MSLSEDQLEDKSLKVKSQEVPLRKEFGAKEIKKKNVAGKGN